MSNLELNFKNVAIRNKAPTSENKLYINKSYGGENIFAAKDSSGFVLPNCTGYCYGRCLELGGGVITAPNGDANQWINNADNSWGRIKKHANNDFRVRFPGMSKETLKLTQSQAKKLLSLPGWLQPNSIACFDSNGKQSAATGWNYGDSGGPGHIVTIEQIVYDSYDVSANLRAVLQELINKHCVNPETIDPYTMYLELKYGDIKKWFKKYFNIDIDLKIQELINKISTIGSIASIIGLIGIVGVIVGIIASLAGSGVIPSYVIFYFKSIAAVIKTLGHALSNFGIQGLIVWLEILSEANFGIGSITIAYGTPFIVSIFLSILLPILTSLGLITGDTAILNILPMLQRCINEDKLLNGKGWAYTLISAIYMIIACTTEDLYECGELDNCSVPTKLFMCSESMAGHPIGTEGYFEYTKYPLLNGLADDDCMQGFIIGTFLTGEIQDQKEGFPWYITNGGYE